VWARVVVNAAGPWAEAVARAGGARVSFGSKKGPIWCINRRKGWGGLRFRWGLLLEAVDRDRYIFILPGREKTLVGPTDLAFDGNPNGLRTGSDEIEYLLDSCRRSFPRFPDQFDGTTVGVRPCWAKKGRKNFCPGVFG
jgi:glycerol-3-phosphate dehydrogenase